MAKTPHPAGGPTKVYLGESLDDLARAALTRLDPRTATAERVRDALGHVGIRVPLDMCESWLRDRRAP